MASGGATELWSEMEAWTEELQNEKSESKIGCTHTPSPLYIANEVGGKRGGKP